MITAAIVEDNRRTAELLKAYLEEDEVRISAVYLSGEEALCALQEFPLPEVMLVDIGLPGMSGIDLIRAVKGNFPSIELIMLTVMEDPATIMAAIKAGASGYVLKSAPRVETIAAIKEVLRGGSFLSGKVARQILREVQSAGATNGGRAPFLLTERETEVLTHLVSGEPYKKIAEHLSISYHTVNNHIRKIYEKMRVNSRGEAAALFRGI